MIRVCDAIMGSGKSSAAITFMNEHPDRKYLYIAPYLDEARRIRVGCPALRFIEPSEKIRECGFTKTGHIVTLLREGRNITTTHAAFKYFTEEIVDLVRDGQYTLIIDESINIIDNVSLSSDDLNILVLSGYFERRDGSYFLTDKKYRGGRFGDVFRMAQSRELMYAPAKSENGEDIEFSEDSDECIVNIEGKLNLLYWVFPPAMMRAFEDVYILTYQFEHQDIHHMLKINNIEFEFTHVLKCDDGKYRFSDTEFTMPESAANLADHIHILDNKRMNEIGEKSGALSVSWYHTYSDQVVQLKLNLYNFFRQINKNVESERRLWSSFQKFQSRLSGKGYTKRFLEFNARATNEYKDATALAYPVNIFVPVGKVMFFRNLGIDVSNDGYALSTMIQWIWRSAIRDGKDIYLYLPSKRMRKLLVEWMKDVKKQYDNWQAYCQNETHKEELVG